MSATASAVGGRLAVPSVYIAAEPRRVGQALPLHLVIAFTHSNDARGYENNSPPRLRRGGAASAGVVRRWATGQIREVTTVNSPWELTVGSSSKEKPTVTTAATVATRYNTPETVEMLSTPVREMERMSTAEERQLLASASRSGSIRILATNLGKVVMAGPVFAIEDDPSVAEAYIQAVESLERLGLAKQFAEGLYVLTPQGLEAAGRLPAELWQEVYRRFTGRIELRF
jgi:hypothetical protein